jgi:hypothetical protein
MRHSRRGFLTGVLAVAPVVAQAPRLQAQVDPHNRPAAEQVEPAFSLHGFSDITFRSEWMSRGGGNNGFALGQFDLYFVSRLAENVSFLGETVFEFGDDGSWILDVERVLLKYSWSDYFRLAAGRGHTALGFWNEAYHHGALLQPTIDRPEGVKFEDDGGLLPVHFVGLEVSGSTPSASGWKMEYVANLHNGRGLIQDEIQSSRDRNQSKAVAEKLSFAREGDRTLRLGPSVYADVIPPDPGTVGRETNIKGTILGAHLVYEDQKLQLLAEAYRMRNDYQGTSARFTHSLWYAILVAKLGKVNPYAGIDAVEFGEGDLFFPTEFGDLTRVLGGVRFDLNPFNAVKLEIRRDKRPSVSINALAIQTAFTF